MARGLAGLRGQGLLPVLGSPAAGVGGVDGDEGNAQFGGHGRQPAAQFPGGHAGDQLAEPLSPPVLLAGLLRIEVQVLDREGQAMAFGPVQQADQGVPHLRVPA
jgi:hypothetical protein